MAPTALTVVIARIVILGMLVMVRCIQFMTGYIYCQLVHS